MGRSGGLGSGSVGGRGIWLVNLGVVQASSWEYNRDWWVEGCFRFTSKQWPRWTKFVLKVPCVGFGVFPAFMVTRPWGEKEKESWLL